MALPEAVEPNANVSVRAPSASAMQPQPDSDARPEDALGANPESPQNSLGPYAATCAAHSGAPAPGDLLTTSRKVYTH